MLRQILLLPACLALAAMAGCGNKGPLYYPPPAHAPVQPVQPAPAGTAPAPASAGSVGAQPSAGH